MLPGYHTLLKSDNAKLGLALDYGLVAAVVFVAIWYFCVPTFWEAATRGREVSDSFWLSWYPLALFAAVAIAIGVCGCLLGWPPAGLLAPRTRIVFLLGLVALLILMPGRVVEIQRFREAQSAYLNRCLRYLETGDRQQTELLTALEAHQRVLSSLLETSELNPEIQSATSALNDQLQAMLEVLSNLHPADRVQVAEIESSRAHDFRGQAIGPEEYRRSLAKREPGPELFGSGSEVDPLLRAEALALAAAALESAAGEVIGER